MAKRIAREHNEYSLISWNFTVSWVQYHRFYSSTVVQSISSYIFVFSLNNLIYFSFALLPKFLAPWHITSTVTERLLQQNFEKTMTNFRRIHTWLQHFSTFETLCNVSDIAWILIWNELCSIFITLLLKHNSDFMVHQVIKNIPSAQMHTV